MARPSRYVCWRSGSFHGSDRDHQACVDRPTVLLVALLPFERRTERSALGATLDVDVVHEPLAALTHHRELDAEDGDAALGVDRYRRLVTRDLGGGKMDDVDSILTDIRLAGSDFLGGLVGWLDSVNKAGLGAAAANASVKHGSGSSMVVEVRVAPFKKIRKVEFIEQIPKSASGKILRRILIQRERERKLEE